MAETDEFARDREVIAAATPGEWFWATSNSWRRLMRVGGRDGGVLSPVLARSDAHPDCDISQEDMVFIAIARSRWPAALNEIDRLRAAFAAAEAERDAAMAEVERLAKIVDRLPKTADGVPCIPGQMGYGIVYSNGVAVRVVRAIVASVPCAYPASDDAPETFHAAHVYSTREAAQAAKEET